MINSLRITPTLPVVDLERAKRFYQEKLGLEIKMEDGMGVLFESGSSTLYIYKRAPTKADHTVVSFEVEDLESEVQDLRDKGVKFEEYNIPEMGIKTVNGISTYCVEDVEDKTAWLKDTEGNILGIHERVGEKVPVGSWHESTTHYTEKR
jgi:catechol 2,3-dioxygenase-like lactoylglutathione lyase family enzyme